MTEKNETKKEEQKAESVPTTPAIQTPMEITSTNVEPEGRGAFRKLFMILGEKVGTIKVSELSKEYLNRVKEADAYKEVLCQMAESIMHVLQQNPKFVPQAESKMEFECPLKQDPLELLSACLTSMRENFADHIPALEICIDTCTKLSELRRNYHRRGRRTLHYIRTFINVDYVGECCL